MNEEREQSGVPAPALSVVVIGRNEGERLVHCLRSVRAMRPIDGELEIFYVDSASTDGSAARAAAAGATVLRLPPQRPSAALARNAGWRRASAPFVLFLDGDTIVHPGFVVSALPEFEDERVAVVWGNRRELRPAASVYNRVLDVDWIQPPGSTAPRGGDALFRRDVLERTGGFDAALIAGEEAELCRRITALGLVCRHVDRPMTGHDLAIRRWSQYWRRGVREGHALAEVARRFERTATPLWRAERRRNLRHALLLLALAASGLAAATALRSSLPVVAVIAVLGVLVLWSAARAGRRAGSTGTRLLYGVHAHVKQIPILVGQIAHRRDRRTGYRRALIEYKEAH